MLDMGFASEQEVRAELGGRLRTKRISLGISQAVLAAKSGVGISTIKLIESKGQSTLENLVKMLIALGLVGELQNLFVHKPASIAMMERMNQAQRLRAPRQTKARAPSDQVP